MTVQQRLHVVVTSDRRTPDCTKELKDVRISGVHPECHIATTKQVSAASLCFAVDALQESMTIFKKKVLSRSRGEIGNRK